MTQEMREEDLRNSLVYFTDSRDGKDIRGFGIDLGGGLLPRSRKIWQRFEKMPNILLLDESHPLITIRRISYEQFLICVQYLFDLSSEYVDLVIDDTGCRGDIIADIRKNYVFMTIDGTNRLIAGMITLVPARVLYAYEENLSDTAK